MATIYANISLQESVLISISAIRNVKNTATNFTTLYTGADVNVETVKRLRNDLKAQNDRFKAEWTRHTPLNQYLDYWIDQCQLDSIGADTAARRTALRDGRQTFNTNINAVLSELKSVIRSNRRSGEFDSNDDPIPVDVVAADLTATITALNTLTAEITI